MARKKIGLKMAFLQGSLVKQIMIGMAVGIVLGVFAPTVSENLALLGTIFISALKAVAPLLVFVLVVSSIANQDVDTKTHIKPVLWLYVIGTISAGACAVIASFIFPSTIHLMGNAETYTVPGGISDVLKNLIMNVVDNPVKALANGNYIGILAWASGLGVAMRHANDTSRQFMTDLSGGVEFIVRVVIRFAPLGVMGLVASTVATTGINVLMGYAHVLAVMLGTMLFVALVLNPLLVFFYIRRNPYPLTFATLRESAVTAFFTRSSAANIPINMNLCERLQLHPETYSLTIPLGATINMAGAAITISVLTLAAAHSLGIAVDVPSAILLCVVSAFCACGTSGVPGGSLMLIPLACGLFGISDALAMQVVAVGFMISVLQDSTETALNSSSDVLFTAAACMRSERKEAAKIQK